MPTFEEDFVVVIIWLTLILWNTIGVLLLVRLLA